MTKISFLMPDTDDVVFSPEAVQDLVGQTFTLRIGEDFDPFPPSRRVAEVIAAKQTPEGVELTIEVPG